MKNDPRTRENDSTPSKGKFEAFYNDHYQAVARYVARRLPTSSIDTVVAATFIVAWRKFTTVPNPSLPWLYRIACYEVAHERRLLGRQPQAAELNDLDLIDAAPLEQVLDVSTAFGQLTDSDAELLRLVYWEDLSRHEIAVVLGLSINAVNVRHHRALERMTGALARLAKLERQERPANPTPKENQ